jgi:hypothetical protein
MPATRLSDPRLLELLACKRRNETRVESTSPLSVMKIDLGQTFSGFFCHRWNGVSDSFFLLQFDFPSTVNNGRSWHRKVSINGKIGIGKLIHLPFFCPSLKREEVILTVVGFRAPLLSRVTCTIAGDSNGKADGFHSSSPNLLFISSSYYIYDMMCIPRRNSNMYIYLYILL